MFEFSGLFTSLIGFEFEIDSSVIFEAFDNQSCLIGFVIPEDIKFS